MDARAATLGGMETIVRDAAGPLGRALAALQGPGLRARDIAVSYTYSGVIIALSDRLDAAQRQTATDTLMGAFVAAGWQASARSDGTGLSMEHPAQITRL